MQLLLVGFLLKGLKVKPIPTLLASLGAPGGRHVATESREEERIVERITSCTWRGGGLGVTMGATVSLVIQPWQKSTEVPSQPYANQETRRNLKDKLLADTIRTEDLLGASQVNPHVKTAIVSVIGSRNMGDEETGDTMDTVGLDDGVVAFNKRLMATEYLIGTLQRLRNRQIFNFFIVTMSLLALSYNIPQVFWSLLCSMGLLFSKRWTLQLAKELGDEVASAAREPDGASAHVGFIVADNKCYMMRQTFMHAEYDSDGNVQPPRTNGQMLYTNNVLWSPVMVEEELDMAKGL